jgi:uncharacterized protein YjdB
MTNTAILVGKAETLIAVITPDNATNKAVKWRSSNDAVATVENGVVTGLTAGSADIIVTTVNGNKTATCAVTVSADVVAVTGVTLNKTSTALTVGITEKLFTNISPSNATNQNVNWSSDKPAIASVTQDGEVTGVSVGSAEITVITVDGNKTAKCNVTVSATSVTVTSVSLNKSTTSIAVGGFETLTPTVRPTSATNQNVTWESSEPSIATVTNGIVIGKSTGLTVITVKTVDQSKTANCVVTVTAAVNPTYGISLSSGGDNLTSHTFPGASQGYSAQTPLTVTVQNTGNQATGTLTIARSGTNSDSFTLSTSSLSSITASSSVTFTVMPNTSLTSGTYSATISVTGSNGISALFNVSFTVTTSNVPVTGVTLNKATTSLTVGGTETLTATIAPANATNKTLSWSSGNSNIASVSQNGIVTGVSAGSTTITVTTSDGNWIASCSITVNTVVPTVTSVTVSPSSATVSKGQTQQLIATVNGTNNPPQTVTWAVSGGGNGSSISTTGLLTVAAGEIATSLTVKATSTADTSKSGTATITVVGITDPLQPITIDTVSGLANKLTWLKNNAQSDQSYIIELSADEIISPQTLSYSGKNNITLTIKGIGAIRNINLSSNGSLFTVSSGVTLTLDQNITLVGRKNNSSGNVPVNLNNGNLVMNDGVKISGNTSTAPAGRGGGVYMNGGTFTMNGGEISDNAASNGGGGGVYVNSGIFTMNGGKISGNTTSYGAGGGVFVANGTFTMNGGEIIGNEIIGVGSGGGVHLSTGGTFTMNSGKISRNVGGGIFINGETFTMNGGIISGNQILVSNGGIFTMTGGIISGNGTSFGISVTQSSTFKKLPPNGGHNSGIIYGSEAVGVDVDGIPLKNGRAVTAEYYGTPTYPHFRNITAGQTDHIDKTTGRGLSVSGNPPFGQ